MNTELKHLISLVKTNTNKSVADVVNAYFNSVHFSMLKTEWTSMTERQKVAFINKITKERK